MIDVMMKAAEEGGKAALKYFNKQLSITFKTSLSNLLTDADLASQKAIEETILKILKEKGYKASSIGFIGEENLTKKGEHLFIIDPIDGTANFSQGLDLFSIPIAYAHKKEILSGVIYHPTSGAFYIAEKGKGAYKLKGGKKTKLKILPKPFKDCMVILSMSSNQQRRLRQFEVMAKIYPDLRGVRILNSGSLDYAYLAENKFNISLNPLPKIWDIAAAKLLVEESGGKMIDEEGNDLVFDFSDPSKSYSSIGAHPKILTQVLKYFK